MFSFFPNKLEIVQYQSNVFRNYETYNKSMSDNLNNNHHFMCLKYTNQQKKKKNKARRKTLFKTKFKNDLSMTKAIEVPTSLLATINK